MEENEIKIEIVTDIPNKFIGSDYIFNEKKIGIITKLLKKDGLRAIFKVELNSKGNGNIKC